MKKMKKQEYKIYCDLDGVLIDFASPNSILIDDREDNIKGWIDAGGIGILHTSADNTINTLITKYKFQKNGK